MPATAIRPAPHRSSMLVRHGLLLRVLRWLIYDRVPVDPGLATPLRRAAEHAIPVYLFRYGSLLDYLLLNVLCLRLGLPLATFAQEQDTRWFRPLRELYLLFLAWFDRLASGHSLQQPLASAVFCRALLRGEAVTLFLGRRPAQQWPGPEDQHDYFRDLVALQRSLDRPIRLVPLLMLWQRKPVDLKPSLLDALLRDREYPGRLAKLLLVLSSANRALIKAIEPIDVQQLLHEANPDPAACGPGLPDEVLARRLRSLARLGLAQERTVVLGPPLKDGAQLKAEILEDPVLRADLKEIATQEGKSEAWITARATHLLDEIGASFRYSMVRFLFYVLTPVWQRIYDGVEVDAEGLERVREAARRGPLILVPSHKSHVDYLIISYVFHLYGFIPPHIAAGINLSFWPMGFIFRGCGAFFLRRSFKGDALYSRIFRAYMRKLIQEGFSLEFFIEGGRSRTGKMLLPKLGLLSMILEAARDQQQGRSRDLTFVPISIGYERIIEGRAYGHELKGGRKRTEDLRGLLAVRRVLNRRYGRVYVSFGELLSLEAFLHRVPAETQLAPPSEREVTRRLGIELVLRIERSAVLTPVSLAALVLLAHPRRGIAREDFLVKVGWLIALAWIRELPLSRILRDPLVPLLRRAEVALGEAVTALAPGADPAAVPACHGLGSTVGEVLDEALRLLAQEGLVSIHRFRTGDVIYAPLEQRRILLDYYKNNAIHLVLPFAVAGTAVLEHLANPAAALLRSHDPAQATADPLQHEETRRSAQELTQLFEQEFVFPLASERDDPLQNQLRQLHQLGLTPSTARPALQFLRRVLQPFFDGYYAAVHSLAHPDKPRSQQPAIEEQMLHQFRLTWERLYLLGLIEHLESGSQAIFQTALRTLIEQQLLVEVPPVAHRGKPLLMPSDAEPAQVSRERLLARLERYR